MRWECGWQWRIARQTRKVHRHGRLRTNTDIDALIVDDIRFLGHERGLEATLRTALLAIAPSTSAAAAAAAAATVTILVPTLPSLAAFGLVVTAVP